MHKVIYTNYDSSGEFWILSFMHEMLRCIMYACVSAEEP